MRMKVKLIFDSNERDVIDSMARSVGVSVDAFCKQAVRYVVVQAMKDAERNAQNAARNNTHSTDSSGNIGQAVEHLNSNSAEVQHSGNTDTQSE